MNDVSDKFRLGDITACNFAGIAGENPVILLPLGSHEDHGPHLPMGDYLLAEALALRIAQAATQAGVPSFVAPCLPFGVADYFGSSPGGMAISAASFRAVLCDLLAGLVRHGLTRIVILNGHGGNVPAIHEVTLEIKRLHEIVIPSFYLWKIARQLMQARLGPGQDARFGHGAEPLLSLIRAVRPETIQDPSATLDKPGTLLGLPVSDFGTLNFRGISIDAPAEFADVPRDATAAAWPRSSAALGSEVAEELVEMAAAFVVHVASAASVSGVSTSSSTQSLSTGTSTIASG
jgi:creatinine amidohydrolase